MVVLIAINPRGLLTRPANGSTISYLRTGLAYSQIAKVIQNIIERITESDAFLK